MLYYKDCYLKKFTLKVVECFEEKDGKIYHKVNEVYDLIKKFI